MTRTLISISQLLLQLTALSSSGSVCEGLGDVGGRAAKKQMGKTHSAVVLKTCCDGCLKWIKNTKTPRCVRRGLAHAR